MGNAPSVPAPTSSDDACARLPEVSWLTYDSRSGSTALARRLDGMDTRLWVTPEIGFDTVIAWKGPKDASAFPEMAGKSISSGDWINLGLDDSSLRRALRDARAVAPDSHDARSVLVRTLLSHSAMIHGRPGVSHVLVKNGTHLRLARSIREAFGDSTRMIFLARDPRAVAESKLRTLRPYHPWETFAWGGSIHAAVRWKAYARAAIDASSAWDGLRVLRFEDYATREDAAGTSLLAHIGVHAPHVPSRSAHGYAVPAREAPIHARAGDALDAAGLDRWQGALDVGQCRVIERICRKEMRMLGYGSDRTPAVRLVLPFAREALRTAMGIARHSVMARIRVRQDAVARRQVVDGG